MRFSPEIQTEWFQLVEAHLDVHPKSSRKGRGLLKAVNAVGKELVNRVAVLQAEVALLDKALTSKNESIVELSARLEKAEDEVAALKAWKDEQLAVESEWDAQAVGKVLDVPLGKSIRKEILPRVVALKDENARLSAPMSDVEMSAFPWAYKQLAWEHFNYVIASRADRSEKCESK